MGWIPTVRLYKDGRMIKVNADDTLRYCKEGWSRTNPNEPKGDGKKEKTPDEITAEKIIQEQLLKDTGKQPEGKTEDSKKEAEKTEPEVPNLDDLQA